jgi:serine/threonine-protein kinase
MTPERWQQVKQLFHSALARGADERADFLARACAGDEALRSEVESLLESHDMGGSFIEQPAADVAAELLAGHLSRLAAGRRIGHFEIKRLLGEGGMGEVYLAEDLRLGRPVALKLLPAHFTAEAERVRRFEQEARAASSLNHPNIVTIHDIGRADGSHFIATEFVDGETLRSRMRSTRMTTVEVLDVAAQIASALAAAHEVGVVHRDIKPDNVMLRRDGYVKVLDFGLAKLTEPRTPAAQTEARRVGVRTKSGVVLGTVAYMSPEQARGLPVDGRTDVWSLGVVLYELVAGRAPFEGATDSHVIVSILEDEPPPLAEGADVPAELERIVRKALSKDREERYREAGDMARDLKSLKQELEVEARLESAARGPAPSGQAAAIGRKAGRRIKPLVQISLATAVIAAVIFALSPLFMRANRAIPPSPISSLAVLPLENLSGDPAQEYFADGMTDALISELGKIGALRVISRTSAVHYKGTTKKLPEIAGELNVEAVVEGTVVRSGDRVQVRVQLIRAENDQQLWSETYDSDLRDVLGLQSGIARAIAREIQIKITPDEQARLTGARPVNREAYDDYLRGVYHLNRRAEADLLKAIDYFQSAIREDETYAPAYAGVADCYVVLATTFSRDPSECYPKARACATKALELDGTLADAHAALAAVLSNYEWDEAGAEQELRRAIELDAGNSTAHAWYARLLARERRVDESLAECRRALESDPVSLTANVGFAYRLYNARRYDEAIEQFKRTLELDPNFFLARLGLGETYAQMGRYDESLAELNKAAELSRDNALAALGYVYAVSGRRSEARRVLAELQELPRPRYVSPVDVATIYAGLGDKDQAFAWLEKAHRERSAKLLMLNAEPKFDALRSDSRFDDLLGRIPVPRVKADPE